MEIGSSSSSVTPSFPTSPSQVVAVFVGKDKNSKHAVTWTLENLVSGGDRILLVHVKPPVVSIPTPLGNRLPLAEASPRAVTAYFRQLKNQTLSFLKPLQNLCSNERVGADIVVLENASVCDALLEYISSSGIKKLVIGSRTRNFFTRKLKKNLSATIAVQLPTSCVLYVISKGRLVSVKGTSDLSSRRPKGNSILRGSSLPIIPHSHPVADATSDSSKTSNSVQALNLPSAISSFRTQSLDTVSELGSSNATDSVSDSTSSENTCWAKITSSNSSSNFGTMVYVQAQLKRLNSEVNNMKKMCEGILPSTSDKFMVCESSSESTVNVLTRRCALECQSSGGSIEDADKECCEGNDQLSSEIAKESDAYRTVDQRYRFYTMEELELATGSFAESTKIGEGGYGAVYRGILNHTTVAIKVLREDATKGRQEFQQELNVLSRIHHPHIVLLLGACQERGCLIYEYMAKGSLEDLLFHRDASVSFPWAVRVRVAYETATAVNFLHMTKPEPIIHRDLKPGNVLINHNFVSKIGDVGLCKLISPETSCSITEYRDTVLAGTFFYMDPEYQRTGVVTPKSDTYALGIIMLQLLTAKSPMGITQIVESAIEKESLQEIIDRSAGDWPLEEAREFAKLALSCTSLRRKERPGLETVVIPKLKSFTDFANEDNHSIRHFYCPILQEIMEDPYIAQDGFSYEYKAIKEWLEKHGSPPKGICLQNQKELIRNHTLCLAITEWRKKKNIAC